MHPRTKAALLAAVKFAIPALIIGYLLRFHITPEHWRDLNQQPKDYGLLAAALLVAVAAMSLSFARWCLLVRAQGIELSQLEAFRLGSICFLLSFVSAGSVGGDLFKAIMLGRRRPGKRVAAVASVIADRGIGLYGLLILVVVALWILPDRTLSQQQQDRLDQIRLGTMVLILAGTAALAVLVLGGKWVDRAVGSMAKWPRFGESIERLASPLRMFHTHSMAFFAAVAMSVGVQGMLATSMYLVARGLYQSPPPLVEHLVMVPIGMLASALPIAPAGLGVLEATLEWLYSFVPAEPTQASGTLVALVFEFVKVVMAILGTVFYWMARAEVRQGLDLVESHGQA
ncbi:MAG: lysylphosphatidylglycerol synthase transmembrane domain-containing protein [Planctomycetota bacterium]